ncbi:esterase/lipase, partial [Lacticaseibacillus paracasei subsp. paracasei Lpp71]
ASLVACIQQSEELQELFGVDRVNFNFTLVALVCPVAEPGKLPEAAGDMSDMAAFYLDKLSGGDAALADHLNFSQVAKDLKLPPFMLIGGQNDSFYLQSQALLEVFAADKVTYTTKLWPASAGPHLKHVFNVQHWEWPESIETNLAMLRQFDALSKQRDEAEADDEDDL